MKIKSLRKCNVVYKVLVSQNQKYFDTLITKWKLLFYQMPQNVKLDIQVKDPHIYRKKQMEKLCQFVERSSVRRSQLQLEVGGSCVVH